MKRRAILRRLGATAAATAGLAGSASASRVDGTDDERAVDVSGLSGQVPVTDLVDDPATELADELLANLPDGADPADVEVHVPRDKEEFDPGFYDIKCDLGCCDGSLGCSDLCDVCYCSVCGPSTGPIVA